MIWAWEDGKEYSCDHARSSIERSTHPGRGTRKYHLIRPLEISEIGTCIMGTSVSNGVGEYEPTSAL